MIRRSRRLILTLLFVFSLVCSAGQLEETLVSLCDPAKLETLGERGANARVQKIVYWLELGRRQGLSPRLLLEDAMRKVGWNDERGDVTTRAMLRNLQIATKLGCTDDEGLADMRRGQSPTVRFGPYTGDQLSVDHIVPRSRYPQLDNVLANLELMPLRLNRKKSDYFGQRQAAELNRFEKAGLISTPKILQEATWPTDVGVATEEFFELPAAL